MRGACGQAKISDGAERVLDALRRGGGRLTLGDKSPPKEVRRIYGGQIYGGQIYGGQRYGGSRSATRARPRRCAKYMVVKYMVVKYMVVKYVVVKYVVAHARRQEPPPEGGAPNI